MSDPNFSHQLDDTLFSSPLELIGHARDHIEDAQRRVNAFFEAKPYTKVVDIDRETGEQIHKVRLTAKIPGKISAVVKDATGNLRDALDHALFASAMALTGEADPNNTGFPFANDADGIKGELGGKRLKGNPPEIRPFLAGLEPHKTGNPLLWSLNKVRNPNTHRVIIPVGTAVAQQRAVLRQAIVKGGFKFGYSRWDPAKNEVEFMRIGRGSTFDYEVKITFHVTFGDIETLSGKDLFSTLNAMAAEVERVVLAIKAETSRLLRGRS